MLNKASRSRSDVGRTAFDFGPASGRERSFPPTTRISSGLGYFGRGPPARSRRRGAFLSFGALLATVVRPPVLPRMAWRGLLRFLFQHRCIKIGAGAGDDLLAKLCTQLGCFDFPHRTVVKIAEVERPERDADQPVHLQAERFKHLAHLAVLALADAEGQPDIGALFAVERRFDRPVTDAIDGDAAAQPVQRLLPHAAERAHAVAAQPACCRQFQHAREPAVIGEQQESFGVDVEPADADQPRQVSRQRAEDRVAAFRVGVGRHQPAWLVVQEQPRAFARPQRRAVDHDPVRSGDIERRRGNHRAVDHHPAGRDPGFSLAAGGEANAGDHLGDALAGYVSLFGHSQTSLRLGLCRASTSLYTERH